MSDRPPEDEARERMEIEEDLARQGLDDEVSYEDVRSTFGLYERMGDVPAEHPFIEPRPAAGPDWTYEPVEGEEDLFADQD